MSAEIPARPEWDAWLDGIAAAVAEFQKFTMHRANLLAFPLHDDLLAVLERATEEPPWRAAYDWYDDAIIDEAMEQEDIYFESRGRMLEWGRVTSWQWGAEDLSLRLGLNLNHCFLILLCLEGIPGFESFDMETPVPKRRAGLYQRDRCRGVTAEGVPCTSTRKKGTLFCRHHQAQAGPTVTGMSDLIADLSKTLERDEEPGAGDKS